MRWAGPLTYWAMMAGTLAITGVGIVDVFGFAGFYSKDSILEAAYASEIGKQVAADSMAHVAKRERLLVAEHPQLG